MVQLKSYYSLCPLIDRNSFMGVSEDKEQGCAIVTLGKNVVNLYKLSDQKQIGGWTSKEHITAPVIYDTESNEYVGVINENVIKTWKTEDQSLDKVKKKKVTFSKPILKIVKDSNNSSVIIFKDGDTASFVYAIESRKNLEPASIFTKTDEIVDASIFCIHDQNLICYIMKSDGDYFLLSYELNVDINTPILDTAKRVKITRDELVGGRIIGVTLSVAAEPPQAHILWSDGRLFSNILREDEFNLVGHVPLICHTLNVNMAWIGGKHLAIYGADSGQEGAVLAVYNVMFGVSTCSHPLKLFCKGARLWCVWDYILLEATQHLAVVPFILYTHRTMLGLMGSHSDKDFNDILLADWGKGKTSWESKESWDELVVKGISEREICLTHFPVLIEENNTKSIKDSLKKFIDIPENVIVNLLSYAIQKMTPKGSDDRNIFVKCSFEPNKDNLESRNLLNTILHLPYVKENMVSALRKFLSFRDMLYLLQYINYTFSFDSDNLDVDFEIKLTLWCIMLLDSHFQQLLLSNEEGIKNVLLGLENIVTDEIEHIEQGQAIISILNSLSAGRDIGKSNVDETSAYYIEEIVIPGL